eukprot:CAMPEP_0178723652 /NCGR_PEP_ID=MMETSP0699-20121125/25673_1 /TAXON_ID=265572 /ORGANISM="Extubocellulus spinifer, Strain CCMP396" /LENGTH=99 /DNA_ID=CAMNT_0020374771 /DNA_START=31 /DNA_END=331 /DNA_ORIENTATION=-
MTLYDIDILPPSLILNGSKASVDELSSLRDVAARLPACRLLGMLRAGTKKADGRSAGGLMMDFDNGSDENALTVVAAVAVATTSKLLALIEDFMFLIIK